MRVLTRRHVTFLRLAVLGLAAVAVTGTAAAPDRVASATQLEQPPVVSVVGNTATVDFSVDPEAATAVLMTSAFEGMTVNIAGLEVDAPEERRRQDLELGKQDPPLAPVLCPDLPDGPRSDDGSTVPYLGCDSANGHESLGAVVSAEPSTSLSAAFDAVLAARLGAGLPPTTVEVAGGEVVVHLPEEAGERAHVRLITDAVELNKALVFTAHSNGTIDSIQFTVAGDCMRYALSTGGDTCATTSLPIVLE